MLNIREKEWRFVIVIRSNLVEVNDQIRNVQSISAVPRFDV